MQYCLECGHEAERKIPPTDIMPRLVCPNCNYIHYENPKMICGSLAIYEDKVLLCRRAIEPQYGLWTLPAGFMENGETMAEGARARALRKPMQWSLTRNFIVFMISLISVRSM